MIVGIDMTASNLKSGTHSCDHPNLHHLSDMPNAYEQVIDVMDRTLSAFDNDGSVPAYYFGDTVTTNRSVHAFTDPAGGGDTPCNGFADLITRYRAVVPKLHLSGPTSFAPLIRKAVHVVRSTGLYHILVIIADGQVPEPDFTDTANAIREASHVPMSIIMVGVGDGPWSGMDVYDSHLKGRQFDNFQFVNYHATLHAKGVENPDLEFARRAMMEIPDQYKAITDLKLLARVSRGGASAAPPAYK